MNIANKKILFVLIYFAPFFLNATIFPSNQKLNYTSVCFEIELTKKTETSKIVLLDEIDNKILTYTVLGHKQIISDLQFGHSYTWRYENWNKKGKKIHSSTDYTFSILMHPKVDTNLVRLNILSSTPQSKFNYLLLDYAMCVMEKNGTPVWYLPPGKLSPKDNGIRDLQLTDEGNFLLLMDSSALEIDKKGTILWSAPNTGEITGGKHEDYHHDFKKLSNGNYMVLANQRLKRIFPNQSDTSTYDSGLILEFNPEGKLVWKWEAKDLFTYNILKHKLKKGKIDPHTHMNSFNISGDYIYAGFRDANWVVKIHKASKTVEAIFGGNSLNTSNHFSANLFYAQHDCKPIGSNAIMILNNDSISKQNVNSSIVLFSTGSNKYKVGEELFRFSLARDTFSSGKTLKMGNIELLPQAHFLVNMGATNRVFEFDLQKNVYWDALIEKRVSKLSPWKSYQQYRIHTANSLYPNEWDYRWEKTKEGVILHLYHLGSETSILHSSNTFINEFLEKNEPFKSQSHLKYFISKKSLKKNFKKKDSFQITAENKTCKMKVDIPF